MTTSAIDGSQRRAARIAGLAYLFSFVSVVSVNFGIFARLIVPGDPAQTARNILAHERLFRIGIVRPTPSHGREDGLPHFLHCSSCRPNGLRK